MLAGGICQAQPSRIPLPAITPKVRPLHGAIAPSRLARSVPKTSTGIARSNSDQRTTGQNNINANQRVDEPGTPPPPPEEFKLVEQLPEFNGNLTQFVSQNLKYPETAVADNIQGRVLVQFIVDTDGSVTDAEIVQGIGGGCDEEALRVVRAMPRWKPGFQNGRAVAAYFTLPITFMLADE